MSQARICQATCLGDPDAAKPFQIEADASKYTSGAVLTQEDLNGDFHLVTYLSKSFNQAERNYQVYDRELPERYKSGDTIFKAHLILQPFYPTTRT